MATKDRGRPLPKFGEWDVNNPASAEGFTVIFNKARDEKKTSRTAANTVSPRRTNPAYKSAYNNKKEKIQYPPNPKSKRRWFCCG
ncbi:protein NOI4 isoform X2 [Punica granatum]|uniref:Protein NOI4 isoform X2 n=1 Tax=Punica granatum TaxID=22663 RepID=A0A6P8EI35_PUNGR|nr:protein NOI4 isoform X2 [Punica granatum]